MIPVFVSEILQITGGRLICGKPEGTVTSVVTDSRKADEGALFVAIPGENADGHAFVNKAFELGAVCALVEKEANYDLQKPVVLVPNTVKAMGALAHTVMKRISVPTVGITGSVGKTTTRDMTHAVLSAKYNTLKNDNNFNNEIGVPLTVFKADDKIRAAVIEMGMDNFGEIDALSAIVEPDAAIITNIGLSHIERLGTQENIYKAKSEIFDHTKKNGVVILNGDDEILMEHKGEIKQKVLTVGVKNAAADFTAVGIQAGEDSVSFHFSGLGHEFLVELPIPGEHNVSNALLACAAGIYFGIPDGKIAEALHQFSLTQMRMDIFRCGHITVINDCYNAAPDSVEAALSVLSKRKDRKVAILGDIAALGAYSYSAHRNLGSAVLKNGVDLLITVGENARFIAEGAFENGMDSMNIVSVDTVDELYPYLSSYIKENDVVLVKASRVMGLERVTEFLKNNF